MDQPIRIIPGAATPSLGTHLDIRPNIELSPWDDIDRDQVLQGVITRVGVLPKATTGGRSTVAVAIVLNDGRTVVGETTLRLAAGAARALANSPLTPRDPE